MKQDLRRQGFLYSVILHSLLLALGFALEGSRLALPPPVARPEEPRLEARLVRPPATLLRELVPVSPTPPKPMPTPAPQKRSDRISVGQPAEVRQKVLELRRDQDLRDTVPRGDSLKTKAPSPPAEPGQAEVKEAVAPRTEVKVPQGTGAPLPAYDPSPEPSRQAGESSLLASAERRVEAIGRQGLPSGTGKQIGALFFDPEGADFTLWVEHLRTEVYRNWIVPQSAAFGFGTHADFEFVVERDGRVSAVRLEKSSGVPPLDKAAQNALIASRPLRLPEDYGRERLTLHVSFIYHQESRG